MAWILHDCTNKSLLTKRLGPYINQYMNLFVLKRTAGSHGSVNACVLEKRLMLCINPSHSISDDV